MSLRILLVGIGFFILWIPTFWAILDVPKRRFPSIISKAIWFAVVSLVPVLGAILYIIWGRRDSQPPLNPHSSEEEFKDNA
jgi:hypothetical protein